MPHLQATPARQSTVQARTQARETESGKKHARVLENLDFSTLGLMITALIVLTWGGAVLYYRRALRARAA